MSHLSEEQRAILEQSTRSIGGRDGDKKFNSATDMWKAQLQGDVDDPNSGWYGKSLTYWNKIPPTISGVLGGLDYVHGPDIKESLAFLRSIPGLGNARALDCGAGIGRLTKHLLFPLFLQVDLMEPCAHMLAQAEKELSGANVGKYWLSSMQKAEFDPAVKYDCIVIQWAAIYLTDEDFVTFLMRCKSSLSTNGIIFFKENTSSENKFVVDKDDSSLTRSEAHYAAIFRAAGVRILREVAQQEWPEDLFPVKMYALS